MSRIVFRGPNGTTPKFHFNLLLGLVWWFLSSALIAGEIESVARPVQTVDQVLHQVWADTQVTPTPVCDDGTYLRRVSLDLLGRIPTAAESRDFLTDVSENKREKLVDRILRSPIHDRQSATFWRRVWLPQTDAPGSSQLSQHFEDWFVDQLADGAKYDDMVFRVLTFPAKGLARVDQLSQEQLASTIFQAVSESKPENLAANTMRGFLGLNLDCAQCHNHPFASWSQNQFWEQAAFFTPPTPATDDNSARLEIKIDGEERIVTARYLNGDVATLPVSYDQSSGQHLLASWVTAPENPYLLRHAVNRVWARFCGSGIMEPLDDTSDANPPVSRELLDTLVQAFLASDLDIREIERVVVLSAAYQRAGAHGGDDEDEYEDEIRLFARHPVRGLHGEQLYDSLFTASGHKIPRPDSDSRELLQRRYDFAMRFQVERPISAQRSIIQSLSMMNGELMVDASSLHRSPLLIGLEAPFLTPDQRVDQLFLAAFSRYPNDDEKLRLSQLMESTQNDRQSHVLANLFWAMLNSTEFNTNH